MTATETVKKCRRRRYPPERDLLLFRNLRIPGRCIRLAVVAVTLWVAFVTVGNPLWVSFVAEADCSKALSKGKVLLRGAQIVATEQLIANNSWAQAVDYLCDDKNLAEITKAAKFPVEAVEIRTATLDKDGLLTSFVCVVDYKKQRYKLAFDLTENLSHAFLLSPTKKE
ncbi:MAG: hypothetical protein RR022_04745 [Angelakisella sp.]